MDEVQMELGKLRLAYASQLTRQITQIDMTYRQIDPADISGDSLARIHYLLHTLTGSAGTFGLHSISAAAQHLDRQL